MDEYEEPSKKLLDRPRSYVNKDCKLVYNMTSTRRGNSKFEKEPNFVISQIKSEKPNKVRDTVRRENIFNRVHNVIRCRNHFSNKVMKYHTEELPSKRICQKYAKDFEESVILIGLRQEVTKIAITY